MGLGIGDWFGTGRSSVLRLPVCQKKKIAARGTFKKSVPCFWPFFPPAPNVQRDFFFFFFFFRCTKLHDQHGGVVGGGAWDFKTYLEWAKKKSRGLWACLKSLSG